MDQPRGQTPTPAQNSTTHPVASNPPTPTVHHINKRVFKVGELPQKKRGEGGIQLGAKYLSTFADNSGNQNERHHPRFHQRPERLPRGGLEFSGDWGTWSEYVSTTNATGLMPCLDFPPWWAFAKESRCLAQKFRHLDPIYYSKIQKETSMEHEVFQPKNVVSTWRCLK